MPLMASSTVIRDRLRKAPQHARNLVQFAIHGGDELFLVFMKGSIRKAACTLLEGVEVGFGDCPAPDRPRLAQAAFQTILVPIILAQNPGRPLPPALHRRLPGALKTDKSPPPR